MHSYLLFDEYHIFSDATMVQEPEFLNIRQFDDGIHDYATIIVKFYYILQ